jgi:hypothetical protein
MRPAHIGRLLLTLGVLVGVAASIGLLVGFEPARLPRTLLNLAAYKLTFIAALGLLAGGAMLLRLARRTEPDAAATGDAKLRHGEYDPQLVDARRPGPPAIGRRARSPDTADASRAIERERGRPSS